MSFLASEKRHPSTTIGLSLIEVDGDEPHGYAPHEGGGGGVGAGGVGNVRSPLSRRVRDAEAWHASMRVHCGAFVCAAWCPTAARARAALQVLVAPCSPRRSSGCPGEAPKVAVPLDWRRIPRPRRIGPSPGSLSSHTRRLGECQSWRHQTAAKAGRFQSDRAGGAAGLPGEAPNPKFVLFGPRFPFQGLTGALDGSKIARTRRLWGGRSWGPSSQATA